MNERALSRRQAQACENAEEERCECRCGGALHGARRTKDVGQLPKNDPHHPTEAEKVLFVRLGLEDHAAIKAAAKEAGLSIGAFAVAVLTSAPSVKATRRSASRR